MNYPRRLIEVDLPIARISAHARREKSIRHGHISTLHIWWARRPLAACRAVICAAIWPDPADEHCPQAFRDAAAMHLVAFAKRVNPVGINSEKRHLQDHASPESLARWEVFADPNAKLDPADADHQNILRFALLDFIADFANWDNSTVPAYLETSRGLTQAAHEALGGEPGTRPLVVDPFAGGGSIPLEALRVGADAFASDLNPVAVLLNKVVLEYIPKYGQMLADEVRKWGAWIKEQAEKELAEFYPKDEDGATPIAYLWARTIRCESPGCGAVIPLMNQCTISKRRNVSVRFEVNKSQINTIIVTGKATSDTGKGTVQNGSVTCPACNYTMPASRYRQRSKDGDLGEMHYCTILSCEDGNRRYRNPTEKDVQAFKGAQKHLAKAMKGVVESAIPNEPLSATEPRRLNILYYGFRDWGSLFNERQKVLWLSLSNLLGRAFVEISDKKSDPELAQAVSTLLGLSLSHLLQYNCNMSTWLSDGMISVFIQSSSIPMRADYAEAYPLMDKLVGGMQYQLDRLQEMLGQFIPPLESTSGMVAHSSATQNVLPENSVDALVTDPPYYFAIPYAELSDFFYVWLKRFLGAVHPAIFQTSTTPKAEEAIQNLPHSQAVGQKTREHFEERMYESLHVGFQEVKSSGISIVVFAHASTEGWESLLNALLRSGWIVTGSWPIDTEREGRMLASRQRTLASSVHLVCRPRKGLDGVATELVGDWRDILSELPVRMHEWMPRLASEGVVGADAIFACLGPALEIFSRYSHVEKANGDPVLLKEYLEHVWAAVSKEALSTIFRDADASGLEPEARLTAMWLWTLGGAKGKTDLANKTVVAIDEHHNQPDDGDETEDDEDSGAGKKGKGNTKGYFLEFDAARKIAQGLGIHLEQSESVVEVSGDKARLLPVVERTKHLFGKDTEAGSSKTKTKKPRQPSLFESLDEAEEKDGGWKDLKGPPPGTTVLDRLHQAMILFGAQRGELLKRFLVDDGVGKDARFWKLAQSLAALYPTGTDERRWVEGVLARKKGLGL